MSAPLRKLAKQVYANVPFKRPVFEVVRRTVQLPRSLTQHLPFRGPFTIEIDPSHRFRIQHWGFLVENTLFWHGFSGGYEPTSLEAWRRVATRARVILDVGANTGVYTLVARCVNASATIVAMEPVERVFQRLRKNIDLNNYDVITKQMAASDTTGTATIFDPAADHELTASLDRSMPQDSNSSVSQYQIPTTRLDDFFKQTGIRNVDLMKVDVEQFEPQVLRGMGTFLGGCKPSLLIEILNARVAKEVAEITRQFRYKIFQIVEGRGLLPTESIQATDLEERNYLLIQESVLKQAQIADLVLQ